MSRLETAPELPGWLASMVPFERFLVDVGGYRMHVMAHGFGRPVLFLHGNPTWGFLYRRVVAGLPDGHRAVMPDLVGLGLSDKPRRAREHTLDNHAAWMSQLVRTLDLENVVLVVQDWGGPIGLAAVADQRQRISGLVVLNTVLGPPRPGFRPTAFHRFARLPVVSNLVFRGLGFPQVALWMAQGDRQSIRGPVARAYRHPLRRFADRVAPLALARMVPDSQSHPSIRGLERAQRCVTSLDCPQAIVWGDRDPVLGRVRRHIERLLPAARTTRTAAGHFLPEEVPEAIAEAIATL